MNMQNVTQRLVKSMTKDSTLQLRIDAHDMRYLRLASENAQMSLSDFVRRELEPSIIAAKIADIAKDFSFITSVTLFGSLARGEQTDASDIDVAIETDAPYKWMGEHGMGRFASRIEETAGRTVDVVKAKYCSAALVEEIARDGRVVYVR